MLHYKFTKQEAKPVTSPLIEVRETYTGPYTTPDPIVKEVDIEHIKDSDVEGSEQPKGKIYKTKKEFVDEMTNAYTKELLNKGLDPMFAKYLVAQDGLESNWGKSSLGYHFNYGGIKEIRPGKGVAKPTNEFINGKMEKVSGNFREFASLQDYVKYKVGLLNNNRYRAFSSHPGDFIFRVVGGGYATDPEYVSKFNTSLRTLESIRQFKSGGKVSVTEEMRQKAIDYLIHNKERLLNSYNNTTKLNLPLPSKLMSNALVNFYINKLKNLKFVVDDSKVPGNGLGAYDGGGNVIYLKNNHQNDRRTIAHELGHVWTDENSPSYRHFVNYINSTGGNVFTPGVMQDKLTSSEVREILAEKAADSLNKPLGYKFTNTDFENIQNSNTQDYTLVKQDGFLGEEYKFNNDKKPMSAKSINSNGEGIVHRKMKPSFSKTGYLNEEALNVLYNLIAQNKDSREKNVVYAQDGTKVWKFPKNTKQHPYTTNPNYNNMEEAMIYKYLRYNDIPHIQTSAIMGNLATESYLDPFMKQVNGNGDGIMQVTDPVRSENFHNYVGEPYVFGSFLRPETQRQLDYIINKGLRESTPGEWRHSKTIDKARIAKKMFLNTEDLSEAARIFSENYLRPGKPHMDKRLSLANYFYSKYNESK